MQAYSTTTDGRFQRSESSTASPVPSNIAGGNTQQAMYNTAPMPYYTYNMMHGSHYPYAPPHQMYQTPMATQPNASQAPHNAPANHQYQTKGVYNTQQQYPYDAVQGGQTQDFGGKSSYNSGGGSVGQNSSTAKVTPGGGSTTQSQSTDLNSSMYPKGHNIGKMNVS